MKRIVIAILAVTIAILATSTVAIAQDPPVGTSVLMTADCSGTDVVLSIDFTVTQAPPAEFVGWVVEREVVGVCMPRAWVTEVLPWPAIGETHLDLTVTPDIGYFDAIYRIWAVDDAGNQTFIYWPQRHNFAHAECLPGPSTVGYFVDLGGQVHFQACTETCWPELSPWDGGYPPEAEDYIGTGQLMNLYGELMWGMHGTYLNTSGMSESQLHCEGVGVEGMTWGGLKSTYR